MKTIALFLSLSVPLAANAALSINSFDLAQKSHQLAITIKKLSSVEMVPFCKDKIINASEFTEMAAKDFMGSYGVFIAKLELKLAIDELSYSTVEKCSQADAIFITKNEIKKIYDSAE